MSTLHYGPVTDADMPALARLIVHAFAGDAEGAEGWLRGAGLQHLRGVRCSVGAAPEACLLRIPMAQYFGGRSVSMLGIAGVASAPESRGRGIGRLMMQRIVQEAAADGFAISTLYPSTPALYRQVGYEFAGHRFVTTVPIGRISVRERSPDVRPLTADDEPAVRRCHAAFSRLFDGTLDRGEYCWGRVREFRGIKYAGFGIGPVGGEIDGYVYLSQQRESAGGFHDVLTTDLAFTTPEAGRRLLGFLADFATMGENALIFGGPLHPLIAMMPSRHYTVQKKDYWMVRILDVKAAFEARGYPPGLRGEFAIDIEDDLIAGNNARWRFAVQDGRASLEKPAAGSRPAIRAHIRGLAPLLSGLYSPRQLALLGWISGPKDAIDAAHAAMSGGGSGEPWMPDMF